MDFDKTLSIAAAGMMAQNVRVRVISENIANAGSLAEGPGGDPYRRKIVNFKNTLNRELGINTVEVERISTDPSAFGRRFQPAHPAADADGYVSTPNVQGLLEMMDLREAQRSYDSNLRVIDAARTMLSRTIELLR
ncbi:MAG: flagellar basal body rod protein FlgC [Alphaproteobacteria bacterium]